MYTIGNSNSADLYAAMTPGRRGIMEFRFMHISSLLWMAIKDYILP